MKNILFVCSANKERSKTAEDYFSSLYPDAYFNSCGTNIKYCEKEGTNPLSVGLLIWADIIFVMENKHAKLIKQHSSSLKIGNKLIVLGIEDVYTYYQRELIEILEAKCLKHFSISY
jgi:predicted protein tyrosine phosphatase